MPPNVIDSRDVSSLVFSASVPFFCMSDGVGLGESTLRNRVCVFSLVSPSWLIEKITWGIIANQGPVPGKSC